nr:MAG TPA: hypothetical protein [Crassvirales sp.]
MRIMALSPWERNEPYPKQTTESKIVGLSCPE